MATVEIEIDVYADIKDRLENWGAWQRATKNDNRNYPSHSSHVILPSGQLVDYDADDAQEIESALCGMWRRCGDLALMVVSEHYIWQKSTVEGAKILKLSRYKYMDFLSQAHSYLLGKFDNADTWGGMHRMI